MARRGLAVALLLVAAVSAGCSTNPAASVVPSGGALRVVATTTVLADLVRGVAGPGVSVESLVPKGAEVHTFDPAPSDLRRVSGATLIVGNGLGLDEWLTDLARDAGATAPIVELAEDLPGVEYIEGGDGHDEGEDGHDEGEDGHDEGEDGHDGKAFNPHLWLDVSNARAYVSKITDVLTAADPPGAAGYRERAAAFDRRLADLDASIRTRFDALPAADRRIVSFHDAFPYFARAYGLEVVGVVVEAPGQEPAAGEVAALIDAIRSTGARAILAEVQFNDRLARQIAAETGATVVADLYTDSLGDPPVDSYEGLIRWDVDRIIAALD